MATYDTVGVLGLTEANAGSDKSRLETTAERAGDEWVLNGHEQWLTNFLHADYVLTYAKTGPPDESPHNVTAFLVPTDAFDVDEVWDTLGARTVKSPRATLSGDHVPDTRRIGEVGDAAVQREQFDQSIADFQGVQWEVAEMAQRVDTARLLTLRAADRADRGHDTARAFSVAKVAATEAAVDNANDAVQLHDGVGYTTERHVERYLRDARLLTIAGGPNEDHKDAVAEAVYEEYSGGEHTDDRAT